MYRGFEFILMYIDDLLMINKSDWSNQLEKLERTQQNFKAMGLRVILKSYYLEKLRWNI